MSEFKSQTNQTVIDVCMQTYGDLNQMYKLIKDSGFLNISTYPPPLTPFIFNEKLVVDAVFAGYLKTNGIIINTGTGLAGGSFSSGSYNDDYSDDYDN